MNSLILSKKKKYPIKKLRYVFVLNDPNDPINI
jgi:hypothetical protein